MRKLAIVVITATAVLLGSAGVFGHEPRILPDRVRLEGSVGNVENFVLESIKYRRPWDEIKSDLKMHYEQALMQRSYRGDMVYPPVQLPDGKFLEWDPTREWGYIVSFIVRFLLVAIAEEWVWDQIEPIVKVLYEVALSVL